MHPARYHLTLAVAGRPVAQGWWRSETVARGKFTAWVGAWGRPGARITLTDEETGAALTAWPEEP
jgi:hypothetical protein